jgi:putative hydrolase of the HAD superfamily
MAKRSGAGVPLGYGPKVPASSDRFDAVVLDFFGTLVPSVAPTLWLDHASQVASELGVRPDDLLEALHASFPERATGALGSVQDSLRVLAERIGARPSERQVRRAAAVRRRQHRQLMSPRPGALSVMRELRRHGLRIGVLTDCTAELPEAWPELPLAALVDAPVFSCVVGMRKPDPRLFALVADRLTVPAEKCLYVGDGAGEELSGASAAGMTAVRLELTEGDPDPRFPVELEWRGLRVATLNQMVQFLELPHE